MLANFWFDLKYAWRLLHKSPGHSLLCVGVVALSVGLATFVFTIAYGAWLKPLDFPNSNDWYVVHIASDATSPAAVHSLDTFTYQELLKTNRTIKHLGATSIRPGVLSEGQASISLRAFAISPSLLTATQIVPRAGRIFSAADTDTAGTATCILSYETWTNYFTSDPAVIGKQARINGQSTQIIGVMPKGFSLGMWADLWLPLEKTNVAPADKVAPVEAFVALEKPHTREGASEEMQAIVDGVNHTYSEHFQPKRRIALAPAHRAAMDEVKETPAVLGIMATAVALMGSMNIGMMFFARLMERRRELALCNALGASFWRLMRQCLLESSFVVLLGLLVGVALGALGSAWLTVGFTMIVKGAPYVNAADWSMHGNHVAIATLTATAIWLLSTLIPASRIARQDSAQTLSGSSKGTSSRSSAKSTSILVGLQVMVSCLVLVVCSNTAVTEFVAVNKSKGINSAQIVVSVAATTFSQSYATPEARLRYFSALATAIRTKIAGSEVGYATAAPATDTFTVPMAIEDLDAQLKRDVPELRMTSVSDNYFRLLGITLRRGRLFDSTDSSLHTTDTSLNAAILDEELARRYWPNKDPLGKRLQINPISNGPWLTVIGVVSHVGDSNASLGGRVYRPILQSAPPAFILLAKIPPTLSAATVDVHAALKAAAFAIDRDLPLTDLEALDRLYADRETFGPRHVFMIVASITAFLAVTGLFGLISRSVALRTQEVGVRRALGATQWQVTALFLRQGALHLLIAIVLGGGVGILATTSLSAIWHGILNHVVFVTVSVFLGFTIVILAASYFPTRRAVALEPGDALRYE